MEKPSVEQIKQIVRNLTESDDPIVHKATVEKYFTQNVAFTHPIVDVKPAPRSIDTFKQVYAVYKVLVRRVEIRFLHISLATDTTRAVIELEEDLNLPFLPFSATRLRGVPFVTVLDLVRDREDGKYYISRQWDIIPLIPALKTFLPLGFLYGWWQRLCTLTGAAVGSGVQVMGLWDTA